jgi:hypothetical protein
MSEDSDYIAGNSEIGQPGVCFCIGPEKCHNTQCRLVQDYENMKKGATKICPKKRK